MTEEEKPWAPEGMIAFKCLGHTHYQCKWCGCTFCDNDVDWAYHECIWHPLCFEERAVEVDGLMVCYGNFTKTCEECQFLTVKRGTQDGDKKLP